MRRRLEVLVFAAGLAGLVFLLGIVVGSQRLFPYPIINAAADAARDLRENWRHYLGIRSKYAAPTARAASGVIVHDRALAFDGYTFVAAYRDGRYDAYLLDMDGRFVHRWDATFSRVWPDPGHLRSVGWDGSVEIHGAHLYGNGDVLLDLGGAGTAKLDRCGKVLWTVDRHTHHHVEPLPDGGALIPSRVQRTEAIAGRPLAGAGPNGFYWDDTVLRVAPDGRVLEEVSVLDMLYRSGWASVVLSGPSNGKTYRSEDPIHLNDVEVLTEDLAPAFPLFHAGDMMLSLRQTNTLIVVEPGSWRVKWAMTGPFLGQHDPDFLPDGRILVYDNRITGPTPKLGNTRLVAIAPATREVAWTFEGTGDQPFYAVSRGEQQVMPNGNILIVDPHGGRLFEIAPEAGDRTVWEWINVVEPGFAGLVTDVQRVPRAALPWVGQTCG